MRKPHARANGKMRWLNGRLRSGLGHGSQHTPCRESKRLRCNGRLASPNRPGLSRLRAPRQKRADTPPLFHNDGYWGAHPSSTVPSGIAHARRADKCAHVRNRIAFFYLGPNGDTMAALTRPTLQVFSGRTGQESKRAGVADLEPPNGQAPPKHEP